MAQIHLNDPINFAIENELVQRKPRGYLGVSQLGHSCARNIWYTYHGTPLDPVSQRTARIWERGEWEEDRLVRDLGRIGVNVVDRQKEVHLEYASGHIDGMIERIPTVSSKPHLFEAKTMADSYWKKYKKKGIAISHPEYFAQCNIYAYLLDLPRCLLAAVNKNTEERCFQRFHTDKETAKRYIARGADIVIKPEPPDRVGGPEWYVCKMCQYRSACHGV